MANARVVRGIASSSTFGQQVLRAAAAQQEKMLAEVARLAEAEFDRIVSAEFVNDRSPDRRRGGRHLLGSSNARVIPGTGSGRNLGSISLGSTAEGKKLGALNEGSPAHTITGNPLLVFPVAQKFYTSGRAGKKLGPMIPKATSPRSTSYHKQGKKGAQIVVTESVNHPGNKPHYMLERAVEYAIQKVYHKTIRVKRK